MSQRSPLQRDRESQVKLIFAVEVRVESRISVFDEECEEHFRKTRRVGKKDLAGGGRIEPAAGVAGVKSCRFRIRRGDRD